MKNDRKKQKLELKIVELISSEELTSLTNLIASIERKENRRNRRDNKKLHRNAD